jgi:hypothetical protein
VRVWFDSYGSEYRTMAGFCKRGNEPSCYIKGGKFLDQLTVILASQMDPVPTAKLLTYYPKVAYILLYN